MESSIKFLWDSMIPIDRAKLIIESSKYSKIELPPAYHPIDYVNLKYDSLDSIIRHLLNLVLIPHLSTIRDKKLGKILE